MEENRNSEIGNDEIIEVKPGLWGVHLNLKALWRWLDGKRISARLLFAGGLPVGACAALVIYFWPFWPSVGSIGEEETYYKFYGDLDKAGRTTIKKETMTIHPGKSPRVEGRAIGKNNDSSGILSDLTLSVAGYRAGDNMALVDAVEPSKSNPRPVLAVISYRT